MLLNSLKEIKEKRRRKQWSSSSSSSSSSSGTDSSDNEKVKEKRVMIKRRKRENEEEEEERRERQAKIKKDEEKRRAEEAGEAAKDKRELEQREAVKRKEEEAREREKRVEVNPWQTMGQKSLGQFRSEDIRYREDRGRPAMREVGAVGGERGQVKDHSWRGGDSLWWGKENEEKRRREIKGPVVVERKPAYYWFKQREDWRACSRKLFGKWVAETERWGWLLNVAREVKLNVFNIIKDAVCASVYSQKTRGEEIMKRWEKVREVVGGLKEVLERNRERWLTERGYGDRVERERIERKSVAVIVEVFDPLLLALEQSIGKWERVKRELSFEEVKEIKEEFSNMTREHLFWVCHLGETYAKFTRG